MKILLWNCRSITYQEINKTSYLLDNLSIANNWLDAMTLLEDSFSFFGQRRRKLPTKIAIKYKILNKVYI